MYGGIPLIAIEGQIAAWNQPLYWSPPSKYISTGKTPSKSLLVFCAAKDDTPESNQTSKISCSLSKSQLPHSHLVPSGSKSLASNSNQTSIPLVFTISAKCLVDSAVSKVFPQFLQ